MTLCNNSASLNLNKNTDEVELQRASGELVQTRGSGINPTDISWRENEALQACYSIALANNISLNELPQTVIVSNAKTVQTRQTYAGLKTMPQGSYEKIKVVNKDNKRSVTHFICKYRNCNAMFTKSTSLIVHYWRHINVRPFTCNLCNTSFTQSGTLSRHNRAVHKIHATVSLTKE